MLASMQGGFQLFGEVHDTVYSELCCFLPDKDHPALGPRAPTCPAAEQLPHSKPEQQKENNLILVGAQAGDALERVVHSTAQRCFQVGSQPFSPNGHPGYLTPPRYISSHQRQVHLGCTVGSGDAEEHARLLFLLLRLLGHLPVTWVTQHQALCSKHDDRA